MACDACGSREHKSLSHFSPCSHSMTTCFLSGGILLIVRSTIIIGSEPTEAALTNVGKYIFNSFAMDINPVANGRGFDSGGNGCVTLMEPTAGVNGCFEIPP